MTTHPASFSDEVQASIAEQLGRDRLWYRLPAPTDVLYAGHRQAFFVALIRVGWPLIIGMFLLIVAAAWLQFRAQMTGWDGTVWWTSAAVCLIMYAVVIPALHSPSINRHYVPVVGAGAVILIASQLAAAMLIRDPRFAQELTYVCMINDFSVMLGWCLPPLAGAGICLVGLPLAAAVAWCFGVTPDWGLVLTYHVGAIVCLLLVAVAMERAGRLSFLQGLMLEHEAQQRLRLNEILDQQNRQLERMASEDVLTGLCNRRHFDEQLQREWDRLRREKAPLAALFIDVDYFKRFNDHYGHAGGDECLAAVGQVLRNATRRVADIAARYGGEEFVVLLPGSDIEGALDVANRIIDFIDRLNIPHIMSPVCHHVTVSIGYAAMIPGTAASAPDLLRAADGALYEAKAAGRHRAIGAVTGAHPNWVPEPGHLDQPS
jgi:diguanylate cyclase (GGDEF)-like protein